MKETLAFMASRRAIAANIHAMVDDYAEICSLRDDAGLPPRAIDMIKRNFHRDIDGALYKLGV
jgi:hypothetical protein